MCINVVTLFTSPPDLSVVFFSFVCLFLLLCVWCFFSLVAAAFLANKDVYIAYTRYLLHICVIHAAKYLLIISE